MIAFRRSDSLSTGCSQLKTGIIPEGDAPDFSSTPSGWRRIDMLIFFLTHPIQKNIIQLNFDLIGLTMPWVHALKALADQKRWNILKLLVNADLCVGALANRLGVSKPVVSQHLKVLRNAGLVQGEKRGYWTHYSVNRSALRRIAAELEALAAGGFQSIICRRTDPSPADNHTPKEGDMCQNCCHQPDKLKDKLENCSPQQLRECHGHVKDHPCAQGKGDPEKKQPRTRSRPRP